MLAPRRLPGLRIDVAAQPAAEALPRMDVAVFVGFASTGPLHVPVAVETPAQYANVFGPDAELAWDGERDEPLFAQLGVAVRAFFSNGGRRCWVIRVARTAATEALWRGGAGMSPPLPDLAVSNRFAVPGVLQLAANGAAADAAIAAARCEGSWSDGLQLSCALAKQSVAVAEFEPAASPMPPGSPGAERYRFRTWARLRPGDLLELGDPADLCAYAVVQSVSTERSDANGPHLAEAALCAAFERLGTAASPPAAPSSGVAAVAGFADAAASLASGSGAGGGVPPLVFLEPVPPALAPGAWARWSDGGEVVWLRMDSITRSPAAAGSPAAADPSWVDASADGPAWRELGPQLPTALDAIAKLSVLTLEMRVADAGENAFRLSGVGLTPAHPAAWWQQTTDAEHYAADDRSAPGAAAAVPSQAPRFPLAAEGAAAALAWIPLGVEPLFGARAGPLPQRASALERDGLARFDRELFLDAELAGADVRSLPAYAENIRYLRDAPRALFGIHAALSIGRGGMFNEASLLAVPDAVHPGWAKREAPDPAAAAPAAPAEPDFGVFLNCATREPAAPALFGPDAPVAPGRYRLSWSDCGPGASYVLRQARQADFGDAREAYRGPALEQVIEAREEGVSYFQVTAVAGDVSGAGSNALVLVVREDNWAALPAAQFAAGGEAELLALHRACLRLAAAGGELFVALALPRHYRAPEALRYAQRLRLVQPPSAADPGVLSPAEARALSYGALYHPWIVSGAGGALRAIPPDGFAAGVMAARASARGAWIAPANELIKDAVALTPAIEPGDWQALQDAQVNILRQDPRGFMTLSADTLAAEDEVELRPINVRRLLILLRRLALLRGMAYVFEPNGPQLRRAVQGGFDLLLGDLFRRGAFAGATAAQSFLVVTDDTINTPRDADAGRFIVELRVAPSLPMRFLSVLLAQSGERLTVAEEL